MDTTKMFLCQNKTVYYAFSIFEESSFLSYFSKMFKVKWLLNRFLSKKKWPWSLSFHLKWPSLEIRLIPRFCFDSIVQNENAESVEIFRFTISSGDFSQTERSDIILILEAYNRYHLDVFLSKQYSFQDSSINHLRYLRKSLLTYILAWGLWLSEFTIDSLQKWLWSLCLPLKWPFLETPPIPRFRFGSIAQNKKAESTEMFSYLITPEIFIEVESPLLVDERNI